MAGFEIGGTGNNGYVPADSTGTRRTRKTPDKKPTLTPEQRRKLSEMIRNGKLRPESHTKYGINTPQVPPNTTPGTNTKYGINTPQLPPQLPPGTNTKYGINVPKK